MDSQCGENMKKRSDDLKKYRKDQEDIMQLAEHLLRKRERLAKRIASGATDLNVVRTDCFEMITVCDDLINAMVVLESIEARLPKNERTS